MSDDVVKGGGPAGTGGVPVRGEEGGAEADGSGAPRVPQDVLARELGGDLRCASCRYNLRGLSVRSVCPECGTPIRATILATVDPYASVLRRISWPRATAAGLLLWSMGALAAAMLTWGLRLGDVVRESADIELNLRGLARLGALSVVLSAIGAVALVRPHGGIPARQCWGAAAGVAATLCCAWVYWRLHVRFDGVHAPPYVAADWMPAERVVLRLEFGGLLLAALIGLRPNAQMLAGRSLLMRMGHVEHQKVLAMAAAVGVGMIGDVLLLVGPHAHGTMAMMAARIGTALIAVGSMLLTVGLVGVLVDCVRLAPVVLRPPLSIGRVMGERASRHGEQGRPEAPVAGGP